jgi:hypothetical protein
MATYGIKNNAGAAQLGGASRSAGLAGLRTLESTQARANLEDLQKALRTRDGSLKHGVLKLVNSSSATRQMGFARKNGLDRWFSKASTFENTSAALRILLEQSGVNPDRASALLATYTERNGQIKYRNADRLLTDALGDLKAVKQFEVTANSLQFLTAATGNESISLTEDNLAECGGAIDDRLAGDDPELVVQHYAGRDERLKLADRVMYRLEETNPFDWSDTHFEIFEKLGTLLSQAPEAEKDAIAGLRARYEDFRSAQHADAFRIRDIERRLSDSASKLLASAEPSMADAMEILDGIDLLPHDPDNFSELGKTMFLRTHTAAVMKSIRMVATDARADEAARAKAVDMQAALVRACCSYLPEIRADNSIIELAAKSLVAKLPAVDEEGMYWMAVGLDHYLSDVGSRLNVVAFSEKVVLFLHCLEKQANMDDRSAVPQALIDRIRTAYDEQPEIQAGAAYLKDVLYDEAPCYYMPVRTEGWGAPDRLIVCSKEDFESWITGDPAPQKDSVTVLRMLNGKVSQSVQGNVESDRFEGVYSIGFFTNGREKVYPRRIQPAIDFILNQAPQNVREDLQQLFDEGLKAKKNKSLSEQDVRNKISPIFEAIWGTEVIADNTTTWDRVEILNKDAHFAGLKAAMPPELGDTREAFSRFLFNLSSVITKLGSAVVWGDEGSSVSSLRLYGYLLMKRAFEENPELLDGETRSRLEKDSKNREMCGQIVSDAQMYEGHAIDRIAFKLIVPATLTRE